MSIALNNSRRSRMWLYFKKIDASTVSCNSCAKKIKSSGNTTNMMKHLNMHNYATDKKDDKSKKMKSMKRKRSCSHRLRRNNADNTETSHTGAGTSYETEVEIHEKPLSVQMSASPVVATFEKIPHSDDGDQARISDAILYFICADHRPFNTIQCKGFKHLMKELAPLYKILDKNAIKKRLDKKYDTVTQIFKQKLCETSYVTITIDTWSEAVLSRRFLGVTVHFIANGTRKIETGNIEVIELFEHTTDYIACALLSILTKWCIDVDKVVAVVINNEPNMVSAVTQTFGYDKQVTCFAHTINSVAEDSIKSCEGLDNLVNKVRSVVKFVKSSTDLTNELHRHQINSGTPKGEIKKLILDVNVMWNSMLYMIERFIELWNVINEVLFASHETLEMPTANELIILKEMLDLLKPLEFVAQECSAENYIIISKIIPLVRCTMIEYKNITQTMELSTKLKEAILAQLESKFGQIEFINPISIATILDPRFKTVHFQNAQALADATYLLRGMINKSPSASLSDDSDAEQEETKYNLWIHHKLLTHKPKEEGASLKDELSLYLASPLASLKNNPLEKWERMKMLYPSLYTVAMKYLPIVATSIPAERLFSKRGIATAQSRNRLTGKRLNKLLFLNSMNQEYWSQLPTLDFVIDNNNDS